MEFETRNGVKLIATDAFYAHMQAHEEALLLLQEAISRLHHIPGRRTHTVDFGYTIGQNQLIPKRRIGPNSETWFAFRKGRIRPTHVDLHSPMDDCSEYTMVILPQGNEFVLVTAFIGGSAPPEPFGMKGEEKLAALQFWCNHAIHHQPHDGKPYLSTWTSELYKHR